MIDRASESEQKSSVATSTCVDINFLHKSGFELRRSKPGAPEALWVERLGRGEGREN